jgi:hypothetical protein
MGRAASAEPALPNHAAAFPPLPTKSGRSPSAARCPSSAATATAYAPGPPPKQNAHSFCDALW